MSDFTGPQRPSGEPAVEDEMLPRPPVDPTRWGADLDADDPDASAPPTPAGDGPSLYMSGGPYAIQRIDRPITEPLVVSGEPSVPDGRSGLDDTAPQPAVTGSLYATQRLHEAWTQKPKSRPKSSVSARTKRVKPPRRPQVMLPMVILLTGVAAFFSWVSAEPFWLYTGHEVTGTVTVAECDTEGFAPRCQGRFVPHSGGETQPVLRISGDTHAERAGETVTGQVVSHRSTSVYIGDDLGLLLRWSVGLGLVIATGFAIAWATGAWRFPGRLRAGAVAVSLAGPLLIWLGALALTW
ncbi:MAG TPA: hypothetical protein H9881_14420 [Candidatus Stackebrandtia excrementipullorum]|nr:hypothetical protein [Candidatus Stackebrandtia excrementipullorum]